MSTFDIDGIDDFRRWLHQGSGTSFGVPDDKAPAISRDYPRMYELYERLRHDPDFSWIGGGMWREAETPAAYAVRVAERQAEDDERRAWYAGQKQRERAARKQPGYVRPKRVRYVGIDEMLAGGRPGAPVPTPQLRIAPGSTSSTTTPVLAVLGCVVGVIVVIALLSSGGSSYPDGCVSEATSQGSDIVC